MTGEIQPINSQPLLPKKGMPKWGSDYLDALHRAEGVLTAAAGLIGKDYSTTYKARLAYPDFAKAVDEITGECDSRHLSELEHISMTQAMKPGNVTERIFQLNALKPEKYRPRPGSGGAQ